MTNPDENLRQVRMYHPGLKVEESFPAGSEGQHYMAGWVLVTDPPQPDPDPDPPTMTPAEVEADKAKTADSGGDQEAAEAEASATTSRRKSGSNRSGSN